MNARSGFSSNPQSSDGTVASAVHEIIDEPATQGRQERPSIRQQSQMSDALRSELVDSVGRVRRGMRKHPVVSGLIAAGVLVAATALVRARRRMH